MNRKQRRAAGLHRASGMGSAAPARADALRMAAEIDTLERAAAMAFEQGRFAEAEAGFRRLAALLPEDADTHYNLGIALRAQDRYAEALQALRAAARLNPALPDVHNMTGNVLKRLGQPEEAVAAYRRAIAADPAAPEPHNNLGTALTLLGRRQEALAAFDEALRRDPDNPMYRANRQDILDRMVPRWHFPMMNDARRNAAYQAAIERAVRPGMHVLEIGTGAGLLAMMAARAGAGRVDTCEMVPPVAQAAREILALNGFAGTVTLHAKASTALTVGPGGDLPDRAELLISEILSSELLAEGVLPACNDARNRLIRPGAAVIPRAGAVVAALVDAGALEEMYRVETVCGFDLRPFNRFASLKVPIEDFRRVRPLVRPLSDPQVLFDYDFTGFLRLRPVREVELRAAAAGRCTGVLQWIRLALFEDIVFENHPFEQDGPSGWNIMLYRFAEPIAVEPGQTVRVRAQQTDDTIHLLPLG